MNSRTGYLWNERLARIGLSSKGIVYILLGLLAIMAAFEWGGHSNGEANQQGVFKFVQDLPAGTILLLIIAAGLLCYSLWRLLEAFTGGSGERNSAWKRVRYFFSAAIYLTVAFSAAKIALHQPGGGGDSNQQLAGELLSKPAGKWLLALVALFMAATGGYQLYYGFSERYKKHVQQSAIHHRHANLLVSTGKLGYIARGIVWFIVAYLLMQAAMNASAAGAGGTTKAFQLVENSAFGSYLLAAVGAGLACYGIFNIIRATYERFAYSS